MGVYSLFALLAGGVLTVVHFQSKVRSKSAMELASVARTLPVTLEVMNDGLTSLGRMISTSNELHSFIRDGNDEAILDYLTKLVTVNHMDYTEVTDSSGSIIFQLQDTLSKGEKSNNPLVNLVLNKSSYGHGILRSNDEIFITATLPVKEDGNLLGTLSIGMKLDNDLIKQLGNLPGDNLAIWTDPTQLAIVPQGSEPLPPISEMLTGNEITGVLAGKTIMKNIEVDDITYQCAFFIIPELIGNNQSFYASYRSMEYLEDVGILTVVYLGALSLIIFLFIGQFVLWISKRVTDPLGKLTVMTERMAELDFSEPIPVQGNDEVSKLAAAFNDLSSRLKEAVAQKDHYVDELARLNQDLEHQVAKRTEDLEIANLRLKREISEKDDFLRAVSHDLGAPLRNIGGLVRTLERKYSDVLDDDARDKLKRIYTNVTHELRMIEQLLELSRLKNRPNRKQEIDLMELLGRIRTDFSCILEERDIRLNVTEILPAIRADRDRIRQLFLNLIDNAIKYMGEQQEPEIIIGWSEYPEDHLFYITDNGIGIPPEERSEIFSVFRRIKSREVSKVDGLGVGLATVKAVVEFYGGDVWVESEPGKGSTFYFTLKRSKVDLNAEREPIQITEVEKMLTEIYAEDPDN